MVSTAIDAPEAAQTVSGAISDGLLGLDIGPATVGNYTQMILNAKTCIWNGPMGVFEVPAFSTGTKAMAHAMADATDQGCVTIVGGGDSVAAIKQAHLHEEVTHVSTGGGAMLKFLEGKPLPGLDALTEQE